MPGASPTPRPHKPGAEAAPGRANVLGVGVSAVNMKSALALAEQAIIERRRGYVCVTGVHGIMEAQRDEALRDTLNAAFLNLPDGMPTVWTGRLQRHRGMGRVFGPDFMREVCRLSAAKGYTHYLYGGQPGVAEELGGVLAARFPGLKVVGWHCPPFRPLTAQEEEALIAEVARLRPDFFWVGLSTPKQERFMAQYSGRLQATLMVGVGAAFDLHTGRMKDAPQWMKSAGLQWLHRLVQEPRRLWKRYLVNNPRFVWAIVCQFAGVRNRG